MRIKGLFILVAVIVLVPLVTSLALARSSYTHVHMQLGDTVELTDEDNHLLAEIRHTTADFRDVETAEDAGYESFLDCMSDPDEGGMGQHYVNGELVGDTVLTRFSLKRWYMSRRMMAI